MDKTHLNRFWSSISYPTNSCKWLMSTCVGFLHQPAHFWRILIFGMNSAVLPQKDWKKWTAIYCNESTWDLTMLTLSQHSSFSCASYEVFIFCKYFQGITSTVFCVQEAVSRYSNVIKSLSYHFPFAYILAVKVWSFMTFQDRIPQKKRLSGQFLFFVDQNCTNDPRFVCLDRFGTPVIAPM